MLNFIDQYSLLGLFSLIFLEESGLPLPIPGDIFIALAATLPSKNYLEIVTIVTLATLAGSTILFTLSKKIGRPLLLKYGKHVRLTPQKIEKVESWFRKYGGIALLIGRLIPGLRIITPIVAGFVNLSYKSFWLYTAAASIIWANIYFLVGKFFGEIIKSFIN